ncbi:helicase HerA domain-containing protein [Algirhabdus cladophorae]|uniref:helicase HerA domain-containing protein n=1 Tax=Algirhabdus cladophorae TaxID=3377108 RepID=UPI003B84A8A9
MNHTTSQLHLGYRTSSTAEELLSVSQEDRRRHVYVIGQTGSGKTTFLKSCILQDLELGKGIALIDPHGDLAEAIADAIPRSRMRDVVFFNPSDFDYPLAFNPLGRVPKHLHAVATSNIIASLRSIWRGSR